MAFKVERFVLNVETPDSTFNPGDFVMGECYIELAKGVLKMSRLSFKLVGQAKCEWTQDVRVYDKDRNFLGTETRFFESKQKFVDQNYFPAKAHHCVLNPGKHQIGFRFQLPEGIPNSFVGEYGDISYCVKAIIHGKGLFGISWDRSEEIKVETLNLFPIHLLTPKVMNRNSKTVGLFGGKLTIECEVPRSGFNRSSIPVYCSIVNESKKSMTLRAVLKEKIEFIVRPDRKVEKEILSEVFGNPIEGRTRHKEVLNLPVPGWAELLQNTCKIIKIFHSIEITLIIPGSFDLKCKLPVLLTDQQLPDNLD